MTPARSEVQGYNEGHLIGALLAGIVIGFSLTIVTVVLAGGACR